MIFIGKVAYHFEQLESTNDYAIQLLAKTKPAEGTVISADLQTAGRGQSDSRWHSAAGENLTLSIILYPRFLSPLRQFRLSQAVALGIADAVAQQIAAPAHIKWPNDIYIADKKVAGVLIQNSIAGTYIKWSVIGIGLNVNQRVFDPSLPNPTSLSLCQGRQYDPAAVQATLYALLERYYLQLRSGQEAAIDAAYQQRLYGRGQERQFATPAGRALRAVVEGTTPDGRLQLRTERGAETFAFKTIQWVMP